MAKEVKKETKKVEAKKAAPAKKEEKKVVAKAPAKKEEAKKAAPAKAPAKKEEAKKAAPAKAPAKKEEAKKAAPAKKAEPVKEEKQEISNKIYHISKRKEDDMWQVKFAKGQKAIKLFKTQAEAIAYAKQLANNQDGSISIHKVDGKTRKQNYNK